MALKNSVIEKLASEGKITYLTAEESCNIIQKTYRRMAEYLRDYAKKDKASYNAARKIILNV
jgi:hypothetical protein